MCRFVSYRAGIEGYSIKRTSKENYNGKLLNIDDWQRSWSDQGYDLFLDLSKQIPHIKLSKRLLKFRENEIIDWISKKSINAESSVDKGETFPCRTKFQRSGQWNREDHKECEEEVLKRG